MSGVRVSHIGIAVSDLKEAIARFAALTGQSHPKLEDVPDQRAQVAIFDLPADQTLGLGVRIELVAATDPDSPIARFLARRGEGLHHICFAVENIETKLAELRAAGIKLIDETPRIGAEDKRIAFVHPSGTNGVLIELEESAR